jgi:hypothetical protein
MSEFARLCETREKEPFRFVPDQKSPFDRTRFELFHRQTPPFLRFFIHRPSPAVRGGIDLAVIGGNRGQSAVLALPGRFETTLADFEFFKG